MFNNFLYLVLCTLAVGWIDVAVMPVVAAAAVPLQLRAVRL
jgi:hypothetical protein